METSIDALIAGAGQLAAAVATFFTDLYNDHVDEINSMVTFFENIGEGFTRWLWMILAQTTWEGFAHFGEAVAGVTWFSTWATARLSFLGILVSWMP